MRVVLSRPAHKKLLHLPDLELRSIISKIQLLAFNPFPHGSIKLSQRSAYRVRIGNYRVVYTVDKVQKVITIIAVGHRKDIYR